MFSFTDVVHFLANEFACLGAGGFAFAFVLAGTLDGFLFWHKCGGSNLRTGLAQQVAFTRWG